MLIHKILKKIIFRLVDPIIFYSYKLYIRKLEFKLGLNFFLNTVLINWLFCYNFLFMNFNFFFLNNLNHLFYFSLFLLNYFQRYIRNIKFLITYRWYYFFIFFNFLFILLIITLFLS